MDRNNSEKNTGRRHSRPHRKVAFPKPGNALYPAPAVLVCVRNPDTGQPNLFTVAWAGNIATDPPMLSISVRRSRYSFDLIEKTEEFTVNLTTEALAAAVDYCGVRSGRDHDKFQETGLTPEPGIQTDCPTVKESPVSIECRVRQSIDLGSHVMFLAEVLCVSADEAYLDENGAFHLDRAHPIVWSHGAYYTLGRELGQFGFSIRKKPGKAKSKGKSRK